MSISKMIDIKDHLQLYLDHTHQTNNNSALITTPKVFSYEVASSSLQDSGHKNRLGVPSLTGPLPALSLRPYLPLQLALSKLAVFKLALSFSANQFHFTLF
jgi:hypothetical protein